MAPLRKCRTSHYKSVQVFIIIIVLKPRPIKYYINKNITKWNFKLFCKILHQGNPIRRLELAQGGHLIHDISTWKNSFQSISFSHVVRQGNAVTHALVQKVRHSFPLSIWVEHVPQDIISFFLHDLRFS